MHECNGLLNYPTFNTRRKQRSLVALFIIHLIRRGKRVVYKSRNLGIDLRMSNFKLLMGKLEHFF